MSSEWWKDETVALVSVEEKELQESDENKISYKMILIRRLENYTTKYNTDEIKQNRGKKIVKCVINPVLELKSVVHVYFCLYLLVSIVWPMKIPWNECNNENPHTRNSRKITKFEKFIHSPFVLDFFLALRRPKVCCWESNFTCKTSRNRNKQTNRQKNITTN